MGVPEFTLTDLDFQLESLDFTNLSPPEFENLIFHLLDEMGFSNLVWRKGGEGNSATDGGRDLEATYWRIEPVKSTEVTYWYEVKYRSGQLERSQVQKAVLDASANTALDYLVIVTNSTVSNPCLDWVREFQASHSRPSISVWQGHDLEVIVRKNPRTLARFIPTALSFSGRCKVIESRFSNLFLLPSMDELADLWARRETIENQTVVLLAAVLSESAYGNLVDRPWGMRLSGEALVAAVATSVANIYPLVHRISTLNRSQQPLVEGIAYLIGCVLIRSGSDLATDLLYEPEKFFDGHLPLPETLGSHRLRPVLATLYDQFAVYCSSANYCPKLHHRDPDEKQNYFARYLSQESSTPDDGRFLFLSSIKHECQLGLVNRDTYCPLPDELPDRDLTREEIRERLAFAESVLTARVAELEEKKS